MPAAEINGFNIHYERGGSGPPLVLLHGLAADARVWQHQLQELATGYDVLAWDMRGYGSSSDPLEPYNLAALTDDLRQLLDLLQFQRVHLGGHSQGALIALDYYEQHTDRVASLILAGTAGASALPPADEAQRRPGAPPASGDQPVPLQRMPALLSPDASPDVVREVEDMLASLRPEGYRQAAQALSGVDKRAALAAAAVPVLTILGEQDAVCSRDQVAELARGLHNGRLQLVPEAGHLAQIENPQAFNGILRGFLESLP